MKEMHTVVLEKNDIRRLLSGQPISLGLPGGNSIELVSEYRKKYKNGDSDTELPPSKSGSEPPRIIIPRALKDKGGYHSSMEIRKMCPSAQSGLHNTLKKLVEKGVLKRKDNPDNKAYNDPHFLYAYNGNGK